MSEALNVDFINSERGNVKIINGEKTVKLTKDGRKKKTPNNSKKLRDTCVNIQESDIRKYMEYFDYRVFCASDDDKKFVAVRNKAMFVCAINIGLRVSDLVQLKWETVFDGRGKFREGTKVKPDKQRNCNRGKGKLVFLSFNDSFKKAITYYMMENKLRFGYNIEFGGYIWTTRQSDHMCSDAWNLVIKNATKTIGIEYVVSSHSCRKTFARCRYDHAVDKNLVLTQLQMLFGHSSTLVTLEYICIKQEELTELYNSVNLGM